MQRIPTSLTDIEPFIHEVFEEGASCAHCVWRWPTLASATLQCVPKSRTVVLQAYDRETRTLLFYSDRRAAKVAHFEASSKAGVHAFDPALMIQLRLAGEITIHGEGAVFEREIERARELPSSLAEFGQMPGPGTPIAEVDGYEENEKDLRTTFCVLAFTYASADWVHFDDNRPRRASLRFEEKGAEATWLVP
ncbi:MAG: pyridoxamine 5'-phosphate oxidase family protein [Parvularcula sp.]|jgi:hypothetical protein|nr:pyridoxamine 5'-phosphate oxidase family protein [Parvularcula sp.]